jgi:hypothetical protein
MRSLFVAAALGLGLLSAAATLNLAAAEPYHPGAPASMHQEATPVHYERHGGHHPHYVPPPRHHWHRHAPPPPRHSWRHLRPNQYGSRY